MNETSRSGVTSRLAAIAGGLRYEDIPESVREVARHCMMDFLGCALAGASEPLVEIMAAELAAGLNGLEDKRDGRTPLIGRAERASRTDAALINGAAGHALDFDDTHTTMTGHPSAPVIPALLALANSEPVNGRALVEAFVSGVELECRLGALMGPPHYAAGFHATATFGTFGAAAACARLLKLTNKQWLNALGLAGTQAAGLKSSFGTMAKPLHAGRAASAGLLSALLARRGFTGRTDIVEAAQGFGSTHAAPEILAETLDSLEGRFLIEDTLFKYQATCYLTHATIEAAAELRDRCDLTAQEIESIEISVSPACLDVCNIENPATGLEGKFSLRATAALAILGEDTGDPQTFHDEKMKEPRLVALRDRARVLADDGLSPTQSRVAVSSAGRRQEATADTGLPCRDLALQGRRLSGKFYTLASAVIGARRAEELEAAVVGLDELDSAALLLELAVPVRQPIEKPANERLTGKRLRAG